MLDDVTEIVATHSSRLQPSLICMPQLQPWCSAATHIQIYDHEDRDDGSDQPWDIDRASWSSLLPRTRTRAPGSSKMQQS